MKGRNKGVKKAVIVKFKGKHSHNHSNVEQLKEEIRQKVNAAREQKNKNSSQDSLPKFQNYTEFYQYENRATSRPSKKVGQKCPTSCQFIFRCSTPKLND